MALVFFFIDVPEPRIDFEVSFYMSLSTYQVTGRNGFGKLRYKVERERGL